MTKDDMDRIDLHTHSNCSDGSLSPRELVQLAKKRDLRAIALTDHDTVAGVAEAVKAGKELGVEVVPGVEISAQYPPGTMHILGYCITPSQPELLKLKSQLPSYIIIEKDPQSRIKKKRYMLWGHFP